MGFCFGGNLMGNNQQNHVLHVLVKTDVPWFQHFCTCRRRQARRHVEDQSWTWGQWNKGSQWGSSPHPYQTGSPRETARREGRSGRILSRRNKKTVQGSAVKERATVRPTVRKITEYSFSQTTEFQVGILEGVLHLIIKGLLFSLDQNGAAPVQDPLRSSFHHQQMFGLRRIGVLVDGEL